MPSRTIYYLSLILSFFLLLLFPSVSSASNETVDPGQITFRSQISEADFEKIDPYTGSLTLTHKDVDLPGNGGLDLVIYRTYQTDRNLDYTVFGLGWDTHFGRLKRVGSSITIELADGTVSTAYKEQYDSNWGTMYFDYWTKDFWKVNMEGTPTLRLPDGTEVVFGRGGNNAYDLWFYATEIRRNNNAITIHYGTNRRVDYVIDSVGRRLDFHYVTVANIYRLSSISLGTQTLVSYLYPGSGASYPSVLNKVTFPDGDTWQYGYAGFNVEGLTYHRLSSLVTPYGGTVLYWYDSFKRANILNGIRFQVSVSKKVTSGSGLVSGTWNYDYGVRYEDPWGNPIHLDYTTITDPCGRMTTYHFFGYSGGYDAPGQQECYRYGLTREKFTTDGNGNVEEAVEYTWSKLADAISPVDYDIQDACSDSAIYVPVLKQQTIYHGGTVSASVLQHNQDPGQWTVNNPSNIYVASYRDFDGYGNAGTTMEYDDIPPSEYSPALRTTTKTFWYNETNNIVKDKPATIRIQGSTDFPGDFQSSFVYDAWGNVLTENKYGIVTTHTYHANGNLASTTDANNHTTWYQWQNGAVSRIEYPEYTITRSINPDGTMASETDGNNHTTFYAYTLGRRLKRVTPPIGNQTIYNYHFGNNSYTQKTRGGFSTWTYFDGLGRQRGTADSMGKTTTITYKPCGLKQSTGSNIGDTTSFDNLGRITRITHQDGKYIRYANNSDTDILITDEAGKQTHLLYATFGIPGEKYLVSVTDADNQTAQYAYNILGSLTQSAFNGVTRTFHYNSKNLLYQEEHPESGITAYTFDAAGNLHSRDDGLTTKIYSYDGNNRLISVTAGSQVLGYRYDNADNLTRLTSPDGSITYRYDSANRMTRATTSTLGITKSLDFTWDGNDNLKTIHYPSGNTVAYTYNNLNQVTGITGFGGSVTNINYYNSAPLTGLLHSYHFGNGQTTTLSYNNRRAMTRTAAGALNLGFQYGDYRGNMTRLINYLDQGKNKTFTYDDLSRLRVFNGPWGNGRFDYYPDGNRVRKIKGGTITYGYIANRMSSAGATSYSYNSDGDMTRSGSLYFDYTPFHRMWRIRKSGQTLATFGYDGNGNRIYKKAGSMTEIFLRGPGNNILADLDGSGQSKMNYIYLNDKLVAKFGRPDRSGAVVAPWLLLLLSND